MKFKIKKLLTEKQLWRARYSMVMAVVIVTTQYSLYLLGYTNAQTALEGDDLVFDGRTYVTGEQVEFPRGRIVYYSSNTEVCNR